MQEAGFLMKEPDPVSLVQTWVSDGHGGRVEVPLVGLWT